MRNFGLTLLIIVFYSASFAQTISKDRITDWSKAGYTDTLPDYGNVINIMNHGGIADGSSANDNAFQQAIAALGNQPGTIYLPTGQYLFNNAIAINRDSIIIKGEGTSTKLIFDLGGASKNLIDIKGNTTSVIADVKDATIQGDTSLKLFSNSFAAGDYIQLSGNDSNLVVSPWAYGSVGQIVRVTDVQGNQIDIDAELRRGYADSFQTKAKQIEPVSGVGIECLYIERKDSTTTQTVNINFDYAAYCWVSGIESNKTNFAHIAINHSTHIEVKSSYFHHSHHYGGGGRGYGTVVQYTSGDCLVANNIFEHLRHSMLLQLGANGNVFAHNYSFDAYWDNPPLPTNTAGDIVCHGDYPYMNLFEGNIVQSIVIDDSHGKNGPFNTFLRNRAELYGIYTSNTITTDSSNFIGNEITGSSGLYLINGANNYEYANNVKGTVTPSGTNTLMLTSLYTTTTPGYWSGKEPYPSIGSPATYNQGTITAQIRKNNNQYTDCIKNPIYLTVSELTDLASDDINVYPSPANHTLNVQVEKMNGKEARISIRDISGKVYNTWIQYINGTTSIITTSLPSGIYFLSIDNGIILKTKRFIISR